MFNFYLITFYLKYFPGSLFLNSTCFGLSDIISYMITGFIFKKCGVTKTYVISSIIAGIGGILYLIFHNKKALIPIFIILSKMGTSMVNNTGYLANSKLFPPLFSSTSLGLCNLISHLISILAPILAEVNDPYPFIVFVILNGVSILSAFFLKELMTNDIKVK